MKVSTPDLSEQWYELLKYAKNKALAFAGILYLVTCKIFTAPKINCWGDLIMNRLLFTV